MANEIQGNGQQADDEERSQTKGQGQASSPAPTPSPNGQGASTSSSSSSPPPPPPPQPSSRAPGAKPVIRLIDGELPTTVDKAEQALLGAATRYFYQRSTQIVRPIKSRARAAGGRWTYSWRLEIVTKPHMVETLTRVAQFEQWSRAGKGYVVVNCPEQVAEVYLARVGRWKLPSLFGVVNAPFLRIDGTPCETPGYDVENGLLYIPETAFLPIPNNPSKLDALAALSRIIKKLLSEFPFVDLVDRSVFLSALLTAFDRHAMATAPLHGFTAPSAGTGKSLLVDLISLLLSDRSAPVTAQGGNPEETEKRIASALLVSDRIISLDNCSRVVDGGDLLCQMLTQEMVNIRLLGHSRNIEVPMTSTVFATGNNLIVTDDLTRRTLLCRLDAGVERPELRTFKSNVLKVARAERVGLVIDVLTILRAWHLSGEPESDNPLGSFEEWSLRVRQPLLWLDQVDPCSSIGLVRENDPARTALDIVLQQWATSLGTMNALTVQEIISRAVVVPDLYNALMTVAAAAQGPTISNDRLGRWLSKNNGKIVGRFRLNSRGYHHGISTLARGPSLNR